MTNLKHTKKALLSSIIALVLCFAMLLGTTYAWFTDSAVSANNKITAGTLDVELYQWTDATTATPISESKKPVFDANILWEPGYTSVVYLSIKNNGSLALKYKVAIEVTEVSTHNLADVMEYAITPDAHYGDVTNWEGNGTKVENAPGINATNYEDIELAPGAEHFFALSIHMDELATNEYMGEYITFDIRVLAGQLASESDSFGNNSYDKFAGYPGTGFAPALTPGQMGVEIPVVGDDGYKVGSILIPAGAAEDANEGFTAKISESNYEGNFTVESGMEKVVYDVSVSNLKEDNASPLKVQLRIKAGLNPDTVKLYHYDDAVAGINYDPYTGYVTFETTSFSPFTVVFDAESVYVPAPALPENAPKAVVTYYPDWVGADIEWGNFGGFAPTEGREAVIDAAFIFECPENVDETYKNWLCDFYVSLDQDLGENEIFLAGQYGEYRVGFHNGDLTLSAGTELPLLGAAISGQLDGITNWKYADVESFVGKFTCGVGAVYSIDENGDPVVDENGNPVEPLEGATFTVALRLINPENTSEFYDVNVVTYTFGGSYTIDGVAPQAAE